MNIFINSENDKELKIKQKPLSNLQILSKGILVYDKYRMQTVFYDSLVLHEVYGKTISFGISLNGHYAISILSDFKLVLLNLHFDTKILSFDLPEFIQEFIKISTNYNEIGIFSTHIRKYACLQQKSDLQLFIDNSGKFASFITSISLNAKIKI